MNLLTSLQYGVYRIPFPFVIPYGPRHNAKKIEKLIYTRGLLLNVVVGQERKTYEQSPSSTRLRWRCCSRLLHFLSRCQKLKKNKKRLQLEKASDMLRVKNQFVAFGPYACSRVKACTPRTLRRALECWIISRSKAHHQLVKTF